MLAAGIAISGCGEDPLPGDSLGLPASAEYRGVQERPSKNSPEFGEDETMVRFKEWRILGRHFRNYSCPEGQTFNYEMAYYASSYIDGRDVTEFVDIWCEW